MKIQPAFTVFTAFMVLTGMAVLAQQVPVFRSRVELVQLDVSVLDKDRHPVRGLTQSDFTILEDGKPQEIAIFEAIDAPDPVPPPAAWMRDVTPDVTTNETRVTRLWVIAVDDALIPDDPYIAGQARAAVGKIIDRLGPDDLASIVFTGDSRNAQDFTNDRTRLVAAMKDFHPGLARWKHGTTQDPQFWLGSVNTLRNVLDSLIDMPNSRKAMIWVTPGAPVNVYATIADEVQMRLKDLTHEVFEEARLANVPIYPVDPTGLHGLKLFVTDGNLAVPDEPIASWVLAMDHILATAANTGGHAIVNTNDVAPGVDSIFDENKSYYLVGYYPADARADGKLHRLDVRVDREHMDVRTRSSYYAPRPGADAPESVSATLSTVIAEPIPVRELPMRATAAPFAVPGERNAAVAIALGVRQPVPETAAKGRVTVTTELRTMAFTMEGSLKGSQRHTASVVLRAGAQGDADYEALSRIDLPPGRYRLRLAAYHEAAAKAGTVMLDVDVPDFSRDRASMSGVVLSATPGRPSAPRDLFRDVLEIVPTAQRDFGTRDRVVATAFLYQNAGKAMAPAAVSIRIVDGHDASLITEARTVAVDGFRSADDRRAIVNNPRSAPILPSPAAMRASSSPLRAAEIQYPLPIARLPPGPYLLTFQVTIGATTLRRDVRFTIAVKE